MAKPEIIGNWCGVLENLQIPPKEFYDLVEQIIKSQKIPNAKMSRIVHSEGGIISANREYLRIERKNLLFDICGAPFGTGFFVSWWLSDTEGTGFLGWLASWPLIGFIFRVFIDPLTYYKMDTTAMFRLLVTKAVQEAVDQMTKAKGLRALSESERKPVLKEFFQRR